MKYQLKTPILKPTELGRAQGLKILGQKMVGKKKFQSMMPSFAKQMALPDTKIVEKEFMEQSVSISGIILVIVYYLTFTYTYFTSWNRGKLTWTNKDKYGITLSESLKYSEKIGATIFFVLI